MRARLLSSSNQTLNSRLRDPALAVPFPQPVYRSATRRLWLWSEIYRWERQIAVVPRIPAHRPPEEQAKLEAGKRKAEAGAGA
jgi:hypothetical protein